ncbi:coq1 putative hexaprenyl diphosphate synthase [Kappamyces sp. JEL0829]|nr:coq1 putative hexaprenyl diphosphate synthase [Kappamyces sp. JEL0829]KAJ3304134.1 coq1 putative hexaprenyl diphosphate synthase [Kappamyces sp. JEL0829]
MIPLILHKVPKSALSRKTPLSLLSLSHRGLWSIAKATAALPWTAPNPFIASMDRASTLVSAPSSKTILESTSPAHFLPDMKILKESIRRLLGSGHPILETVSTYYFNSSGGKNIRPLLVLLMSKATASLSRPPELVDINISQNPIGREFDSIHDKSPSLVAGEAAATHHGILASQQRLAEITEMIHTASLLHDDVIDLALTRRAQNSANKEFGNKMAILAGDFLLARASLALSRLRNVEVVELLSTVIANLVEGEFMQLRNSSGTFASHLPPAYTPSPIESDPRFNYYLQKTYLKTASLIAKSCHASTLLSHCPPAVQQASYNYGRNLGMAFQLVDDMLDFTSTTDLFGKPVNADLQLGLATAPVLYASQSFPSLDPLISRNFSHPGDVDTAKELVAKSDGVERTRELAKVFCDAAQRDLQVLHEGEAKDALVELTDTLLSRQK